MNEYEPWKELGIDELQYFKNKYIDARKENEQLQSKFDEAVEVIKIIDLNFKKITKCPDNSCDGCHEDAKIAAEYSSKLLNSLDKEK